MFKELAGLRERYGVTGALYAFRLPVCKKFYLAVWLFARAAASGEYKPGMPVAEITAGNMGLALAEQCAKYRSPLYLVPIGRLSEEKRRALEEKGARLVDARPKEGEAYWLALERTLEEIVVIAVHVEDRVVRVVVSCPFDECANHLALIVIRHPESPLEIIVSQDIRLVLWPNRLEYGQE